MIKLPFWMDKSHSTNLVAALNAWFAWMRDVLNFPIRQFDVDTAALIIVDLIAWERDVQRFDAEPEWLYRLRVKHAYANARDAGSAAGLKRIWERMGFGYIEIEERMEGRAWDVVAIQVTETFIAQYPELLNIIIEKYGRTCRRYEWTTIVNVSLTMRAAHVEHSSENLCAKLEI